MDPTEKGFRQDLADFLRDGNHDGWSVTARIYADWLAEQGHDSRADRLRRAVAGKRHPGLRWPRVRQLDGLTEHQRQQLAIALSRPVGILCGTPGTGKTFAASSLVRALVQRARLRLRVVAPTGKAAVRLSATMQQYYSVIFPVTTIHQLLEIGRNGHDGEGWGFLRNADRPLDASFVIVDEASMLDTDLTAALFSACRSGTHILMVGDPNQLPPVGHGAPLRDMMSAGVPCGRLTEIQRNAGRIVEVCAAIQAGESWEPFMGHPIASVYSATPDCNIVHYECADSADQLKRLRLQLDALRLSQWDHVWDVQVLAAVNARGELSRQNLNRLMQHQLNDDAEGTADGRWRPGDKVVCLRNHWAQPEHPPTNQATIYVANGDVGQVVDMVSSAATVHIGNPVRSIRVPLPRTTNHDEDDSDHGGNVREQWDLAYAITAHKAQGSEWPVVILMIDASPAAKHICTREWVYTALSRGKELVITIGRLSVLKQMCVRRSLEKRKTFLTELLCDGSLSS